MKENTLLLIGALAFVLQNASAQDTLYLDDFEGQTPGDNAASTPFFYANAGHGQALDPQNYWAWVGNGTAIPVDGEFTVTDVPSGESDTTAAVLTAIVGTGGWFSFSSAANTSAAAAIYGWTSLSDLTFSFDIATVGSGASPVTIWADQFPGNVKTFDASYIPTGVATDGSWYHVSFTLDQLVPSGTSGAYDPSLGIELALDGNGWGSTAGTTNVLMLDNILLVGAPEPGTITLLALGGLGALVAVRRRRA